MKPATIQASLVQCALGKMTQSRLANFKHSLAEWCSYWLVQVANLAASSLVSFCSP